MVNWRYVERFLFYYVKRLSLFRFGVKESTAEVLFWICCADYLDDRWRWLVSRPKNKNHLKELSPSRS